MDNLIFDGYNVDSYWLHVISPAERKLITGRNFTKKELF